MADEITPNEEITTQESTVLTPVPMYSQQYDDMTSSLNAAIEARKALMAPLIDIMEGEAVTDLIEWLESNYDNFRNEPLVAIHFDGALGCVKRLRDAARS